MKSILSKRLKTMLLPLLALPLVGMAIVACSDDEEAAVVPTQPAPTFHGKKLLEAMDFRFEYDKQGRCCHAVSTIVPDSLIKEIFPSYRIDYSKRKFYIEDAARFFDVTFTNEGYLKTVGGSWSHYSDNGDYGKKGNDKYSFSYDAAGHLLKIEYISDSEGRVLWNGQTFSSKYVTTLYWQGDNLQQIVKQCQTVNNGVQREESVTYRYDYDGMSNDTGLMLSVYSKWLEFSPLAMVGLMGKSPAQLPVRLTCTGYSSFEPGNTPSFQYAYHISYEKDGAGNISVVNYADGLGFTTTMEYLYE